MARERRAASGLCLSAMLSVVLIHTFVAAAAAAAKATGTTRPAEGVNDIDNTDCIAVVTWEEEIPGGTIGGRNGRGDVPLRGPERRKNKKAWTQQLREWLVRENPLGGGGQMRASNDDTGLGGDDYDESTKRSLRDRISEASSSSGSVLHDDPHPLRTDEWQLQVRWRKRRFVFEHPSVLVLDFHPTGYVRCRRLPPRNDDNDDYHGDASSRNQYGAAYGSIGTWELTPTGLSWTLGLDDDDDDDENYDIEGGEGGDRTMRRGVTAASRRTSGGTGLYSFHADLHLHPFGPHPRLSRGVVLHDKGSGGRRGRGSSSSRWFRPVVATFSGIGTGKDTVDLSYRQRRRQ